MKSLPVTTVPILTLAMLFLGCSKSSENQVVSIASPNGNLKAIVTEINGGATTSFGYDIAIEAKGSPKVQKVVSLYGAIRNEQAYGVDLTWAGNNVLTVKYLRAKAVTNHIQSIEVGGYKVQVVLESGVNDPKAPAGGMLFNLKNRSH